MKLKIFTLAFTDAVGGFDDTAVQSFLEGKEVVDVVNHFFVHERTPHLTLIVSYREASSSGQRRTGAEGRVQRKDHRGELDEAEKKVFDALRVWRAARSRQDGVPPYIVATNGQLATFIRLRAATKAALTQADGFGEVKSEQYGDQILKILAEGFDPSSAARSSSPGEGQNP